MSPTVRIGLTLAAFALYVGAVVLIGWLRARRIDRQREAENLARQEVADYIPTKVYPSEPWPPRPRSSGPRLTSIPGGKR